MVTGEEVWEYCAVEYVRGAAFPVLTAANLIFFTSEGLKIESLSRGIGGLPKDKIPAIRNKVAMRIAELGTDGWEMVGRGDLGTEQTGVYFKRKRT